MSARIVEPVERSSEERSRNQKEELEKPKNEIESPRKVPETKNVIGLRSVDGSTSQETETKREEVGRSRECQM